MEWALPAFIDGGIILLPETQYDSRLDESYWEIAEAIHASFGRTIIFSDWLYEEARHTQEASWKS